ncbi:MAG: hypothetical protein K940chlam7_01369 [Chlamydiae bacterium]|nr:hypothetical protein [Chlamydiota bacterium]
MLKWIGGFLDRIFVVAGALLFSQAPNFFQHYTQRLGGHVAELKLQINVILQAAEKSGKNLQEYVHKFVSQADLDFTSQGEIMQSMISRFHDLDHAYTSLIHSTVWTRPFLFVKDLKMDIAKMTLSDYSFGVTLTAEGAVYALFGMGFGYLLYKTLSMIVARISRLFSRSRCV